MAQEKKTFTFFSFLLVCEELKNIHYMATKRISAYHHHHDDDDEYNDKMIMSATMMMMMMMMVLKKIKLCIVSTSFHIFFSFLETKFLLKRLKKNEFNFNHLQPIQFKTFEFCYIQNSFLKKGI